ncbi:MULTISPECIES: DUF2617 family protein [unclassified Streptomyces]|uniref:DUF2617 family protein n=1 Tax=unclassified Streptomyces TaxID=2593676 RepID=UPI00382C82EC
MLTTLQTAYTDTRAGDLAWCLGMDELPALAVLDRELPGIGPAAAAAPAVHVQLRLLGASHQVLLDSPSGRCSETVACMPGSSTPLPFGVARRVAGWDYEFAARIETLTWGGFAGRAQELLALVADHPNGLAGTFPGDPHAFTAMLVQYSAGSVLWRTWHAYPQEGRLVATRSRLSAQT